jgi:DNA-binding response OmpR family regulator
MLDPKPKETLPMAAYVFVEDLERMERRVRMRRDFHSEEETVDPWSYAAKRGFGTLRLSLIEYRILRFLASRPNQALSLQRIARAVSTAKHYVSSESLTRHIHSLRGQLGFYSDYIQSVPYIGYRFKG